VLKRVIRTLWLMQDEMDRMWILVELNWRLNERHYSALQDLDKATTSAKFGAEQVKLWRRSHDVPPPPFAPDDPRHPRFDTRYGAVSASELPAIDSHPSLRPAVTYSSSRTATACGHWSGCWAAWETTRMLNSTSQSACRYAMASTPA